MKSWIIIDRVIIRFWVFSYYYVPHYTGKKVPVPEAPEKKDSVPETVSEGNAPVRNEIPAENPPAPADKGKEEASNDH